MKLTVPLTGRVIQEGELFGDGKLKGDPNDPIRLIDINLGNVSWTLVSIDLENEEATIEVAPGEKVSEPTGEIDAENNPVYRTRPATEEEKVAFIQYAQDLVSHTKDELYTMSKCSKLKRPFKEVIL